MSLCILQITDLHLFRDPGQCLRGVATEDSFRRVLQLAQQRFAHADWVVLTGDLAHDEERDTYRRLREALGDWLPRCLLLPGNHDQRALLREVFPDRVGGGDGPVTFTTRLGDWQLVGLDSHQPGQVSGRLGHDQLQWLNTHLAPDAPSLLFLHHPPFPVHSPWLDAIRLEDGDVFMQLVAARPQVRAVCCGHVHQELEAWHGPVRLLASPSTSLQFQPGTDALAIAPHQPGFRVLTLDGDALSTEIVRVSQAAP